jgi:hypothetical protein
MIGTIRIGVRSKKYIVHDHKREKKDNEFDEDVNNFIVVDDLLNKL